MENKTTYIGDLNLGLKDVAWEALRYFATMEPTFATMGEFGRDVEFDTHARYNGRERSIIITMKKQFYWDRAFHVEIGEDRKSDQIYVMWWEAERVMNTPEPVGDDVYFGQRAYFSKVIDAVNFAYDKFAGAYPSLIKE